MATMSREVLVAGVGMIPFTKPGQNASYDEMGAEAIRLAIADGSVSYDLVVLASSLAPAALDSGRFTRPG
jgi:sterol carrier protein 2